MILDKLFGKDEVNEEDKANSHITDKQPAAHNEQLEKEKEYKAGQSNGKEANDPSAQRNTGAQGYTQRNDQKDQLENLHIGGSETEPQGGNDHSNSGEVSSGPGFESEGSVELDHTLRTRHQEFGDDAPSGPPTTAHD
ncbi:hypothetical protein MTX78_09905 [Hymenobacter tibetensis]|uniref:Uncharacterized protein n=1 Tax=Hymenobacter tibetensis TaxID=497967 RepID=A0ABY4D2Y4_9BACT|nr:hypothetical protein [Hymenobacter tibetensis]UOG76894.1 hypothetical protein MTX78_09905 [Hymenobacter tibetensis]